MEERKSEDERVAEMKFYGLTTICDAWGKEVE